MAGAADVEEEDKVSINKQSERRSILETEEPEEEKKTGQCVGCSLPLIFPSEKVLKNHGLLEHLLNQSKVVLLIHAGIFNRGYPDIQPDNPAFTTSVFRLDTDTESRISDRIPNRISGKICS